MTPNWGAVPDESMTYSDEPAPQHVVWLDPGRMTGWVSYDVTSAEISGGQLPFFLMGEWLARHLDCSTWVGWEAFTVRPGSARVKFEPDSLEVIGMTRWLAYHQDARMLKPQQPSDRSIGLLHLKRVGWRVPGQDHRNDAAAHLLAFLLANQLAPAEMLDSITTAGTEEEK